MSQNRNQYFDFLRGLAIIMVIGIHTFPGHEGFGSVKDELIVLVRQIINCAVPIFLAISGYFVSQKQLFKKSDYYSFYKRQIPKVYIPALIWGLPWLFLAIYSGENIFITICLWLCCGLSVLYFIALIIQCYLLLPIIKITPVIQNIHVYLVIAAIITVVATIAIVWIRSICGLHIKLIAFAGPFPLWIVYFVLGIHLAKTNRDFKVGLLIVLALVGLVLQMIEAHFLDGFHGVGDDIKISWVLYSVVIILLLFSKKSEKSFNPKSQISRIIILIGSISFSIYLTHYLVRLLYYHFVPLHYWPLDWAAILSLDIVFLFILKKTVPLKWSKLLGI